MPQLSINLNDMIILKAVTYPYLVTQTGVVVYFRKMHKNKYACVLDISNPDSMTFDVHERDILEVYDAITNVLVYEHDPADGL